jgi:tRNA(adenine34) deaminase
MFNNIEKGFQVAFGTAWETFKAGSTPIGACILNEIGDVVAIGRNQIHAYGDGTISFHQLAHAEANAVLKVSEETTPNLHPNIRQYSLYTTMEPCPFCFGAIVMGSIRKVKFAARDGIAGATALNKAIDYIKSKNIFVEGPFNELELVQIAIQTCFEISKRRNAERVITRWSAYCPKGVEIGRHLYEHDILNELVKQEADVSIVYDSILNY